MPASFLLELVGEVVFKPLLEGACHLTGRGILGWAIGNRFVVVPEEPEAPPRNWKSRKKWLRRQQAANQVPSHLRPVKFAFTIVTGIGLLTWLLLAGLIVLVVWLV